MSYLDQSPLVNYQNKVSENEIRIPQYGLIDLFKKQTPGMPFNTPELRAAVEKYASGNSIEVPALTEKTIVTSTSETFDIPDNLSVSAKTTLTFITIFAGYGIYPSSFANNAVGQIQYQINKLKEIDKAMALKLEQYLNTHLSNNKTQVWEGDDNIAGYNFDDATDALQISLDAQNETMFSDIRTMAKSNDWDDEMMDMAMNPTGEHVLNQYKKYGQGNEKNLQFQNIPETFESNRVTNTAGKRWSGYLVEADSVGLLENFKPDFLNRESVGEARWDVSSQPMPQLGHRVMLYQDKQKVDSSNIGSNNSHSLMSTREVFGFAMRFTLLKKYNSDSTTRVNSILKIDASKT